MKIPIFTRTAHQGMKPVLAQVLSGDSPDSLHGTKQVSGEVAQHHLQSLAWSRAFTKTTLVALATLVLMFSDAMATPPTVINIEIDYMVQRNDAGIVFTHEPQQIEIDAVVQMFACRGITCNIIVDDELPYIEVLQRDPNNSANFFGYTGTNSFGQLKHLFRDNGACWHYCIFGHRYQANNYDTSSSSGLGELGGDDFIVTLGAFTDSIGTPFDRAATLAHELGHNLGLNHCGNMNCGLTGNTTPNYPSTMSYFCQLEGVWTRYVDMGLAPRDANYLKEIDFSYGSMCNIYEADLDEFFGIGMKKLDWDCNGAIEFDSVVQDLDGDTLGGWCISMGRLSYLNDYNDWAGIQDNTCPKDPQELDNLPEISCITYEEHQQYLAEQRGVRVQPELAVEPCNANRMLWAVPTPGTWGGGWCNNPYNGFTQAYNAAWAGDIIYLKYGVYNVASPTILLDKRMIITATHSALIRPVGKGGEGK